MGRGGRGKEEGGRLAKGRGRKGKGERDGRGGMDREGGRDRGRREDWRGRGGESEGRV